MAGMKMGMSSGTVFDFLENSNLEDDFDIIEDDED